MGHGSSSSRRSRHPTRGSWAVPPRRAGRSVDDRPGTDPDAQRQLRAGGLQWPSVVQTDDGYLMYLAIRSPRRQRVDWPNVGRRADHDDGAALAAADWGRGQVDRPRVAVPPRDWPWSTPAASDGSRPGLVGRWDQLAARWRAAGHHPRLVLIRQRLGCGPGLPRRALDYYLEIGSASGGASTDVFRRPPRWPR